MKPIRSSSKIDGISEHSMTQVKQMAETISKVSEEAQDGLNAIEHIVRLATDSNEAIQEISASSEETMSSTEEIVAASDTLRNLIEELHHMINRFRT